MTRAPALLVALTALTALAALTTLASCTSAAKRETGALAAAVDRFRAAGDNEKSAAAAAIAAVTCSDSEVAATKAKCSAGAEATARALALKSEVEKRLAELEAKTLAPDDPAARALPKTLDESERKLREGRDAMRACESMLGALRLKHGV